MREVLKKRDYIIMGQPWDANCKMSNSAKDMLELQNFKWERPIQAVLPRQTLVQFMIRAKVVIARGEAITSPRLVDGAGLMQVVKA